MSTDPGGGVTVTENVEAVDVVEVTTSESAVVFLNGGVQGPPGAEVLLRRQGTSGVIEWRHDDEDVWQKLIDLADGVVAVKPVPPTLTVGATTVTDDPTKAKVTVTQPDDLEALYVMDFVLPRGPQGLPGRDGQPRFTGDGPPGDDSLYPDAVEGDLYWDRIDGKIYTFHKTATIPTDPGSGGGADPGADPGGDPGAGTGTGSGT